MTAPARPIGGALTRFRVLALTVGVNLVILVCIGVPLKYLADFDAVVAVVGPLHGFLYMAYLLVAFDLVLLRLRWPLLVAVGVMVGVTVPFLSFVVERRVTERVRGLPPPPA